MVALSADAAPSSTSALPSGDGYAHLHGRRQAMRMERERKMLKTGKRSIEVTWSLTSLGAERAGPKELLDLVRNHWHIENRVHYVRDFTYDEDRCRAYVRHLPGKSGLLEQRGHRYRALRRTLPICTRGQPALRRPRPRGPRRDYDRAQRLIPHPPPQYRLGPKNGAAKQLRPSRTKTLDRGIKKPP